MMHMRLLIVAAVLAAILAIAYRSIDPTVRKNMWKVSTPYLRTGALAAGTVILLALFIYNIGTH